ncbi:MAG: hypothetical protein JNM85_01890 [Chthonomonas sp.]|nr:hypothetical protein [Chthonomonas sp.]
MSVWRVGAWGLLGAMGLVGTTLKFASATGHDGFRVQEMGREASRQVDRYIPYVRQSSRIAYNFDQTQRLDEVESVAQMWIRGRANGVLGELEINTAEESSTDGVKRQIVMGRNAVVLLLFRKAERSADPTVKADCYTLAVQVAEVMKYSDLASYSSAIAYQNSAIQKLDGVPLGSTHRERLSTLPDWHSAADRLAQMTLREAILFDDQVRKAHTSTSVQSAMRLVRQTPAHMSQAKLTVQSLVHSGAVNARVAFGTRVCLMRQVIQSEALAKLGITPAARAPRSLDLARN